METKNLSYLCFYDRSNDGQLEILRDKVNELILPRRPNFKFDIFHDWKSGNLIMRIVCCTSTE